MGTSPKPSIFSSCGQPSGRQLVWALLFGLSLPVVLAILHYWKPPTAVRYLVPVVPLYLGGQYVRALMRDIRTQKDELQLRIYLEAAAVVVSGMFILMLVYPSLRAAGLVGPLDESAVLILMAALGVVGYFGAVRRYR